jgi:aminomethyltransferase
MNKKERAFFCVINQYFYIEDAYLLMTKEEEKMKKTILYDEHLKHNAKMVEYAGYLMPVEYQGLTEEHVAVRQNCGLFDVSHMGEIMVEGKEAKKLVNYLMTGRVSDALMKMSYGLMLYPNGGVVDDLMAYHFNDEKILLVVNAGNLEKDDEWIKPLSKDFEVVIKNISQELGQLALQGKTSVVHLQKFTDYNLSLMQMFDFAKMHILGREYLVSRSGYTGEDGFEIYGANMDIVALFQALVNDGVTLCGLGARDTLRFEANMPLYGHEIDQDINPLEATLGFAVDFTKDFIGKEALLKVKEEGLKRKIVALELIDRGIARSEYEVEADGKVIGYITTGYMIPGVNKAYALAMLDEGYWNLGAEVMIRIRKNLVKAVVRSKKFLNKKYIK